MLPAFTDPSHPKNPTINPIPPCLTKRMLRLKRWALPMRRSMLSRKATVQRPPTVSKEMSTTTPDTMHFTSCTSAWMTCMSRMGRWTGPRLASHSNARTRRGAHTPRRVA